MPNILVIKLHMQATVMKGKIINDIVNSTI